MTAGGHFLLLLAMAGLVVSLAGYLPALRAGGRPRALLARGGYLIFAAAIAVATAWLFALFLRHDYRVDYVAQYSSHDLPLGYLISAVWAGQEGSFLIWVAFSAAVGFGLRWRTRELEAPAMAAYELSQVFLVILLLKQSPFKLLPAPAANGQGLNPLLQDFWMSIHPPLIFLGYAAFAVPFALAMAACWRNDRDEWVRLALPWTGFGFVALGAGIVVGGFWAYRVLGWGGYWGWDPVENASLLPWLTGTALLHGLLGQRGRGRFPRTNIGLAALSFLLILYGTFLTRSGVLAEFSVHSFADLGITGWLVWYIVIFGAMSVAALVWRWRRFAAAPAPMPFFSRETALLLVMLVLCASAMLVGLGTSAPLLTRFRPNPAKVDPSYYTQTHVPVAILLGLLLAFGPLFRWGEGGVLRVLRRIVPAAAIGAALAGATLLLGFPGRGPFLIVLAAMVSTAVHVQLAGAQLRRDPLWIGGPLSHCGLALMLVGIVLSGALDTSYKVTLPRGVAVEDAGLSFEFLGMKQTTPQSKPVMEVRVTHRGRTFLAAPRMYYDPRRKQQYANPHIERFLAEDVYIEPLDYRSEQASGRIRIVRGETVERYGYSIRFVEFDMGAHEEGGDGAVGLGAVLEVRRGEETARVEPRYVLGAGEPQHVPVPLPGGEDRVSVEQVRADERAVVLRLAGPGIEQAAGGGASPGNEVFTAQVSRKPFMGLFWGGIVLLLAGAVMAIVRRCRELTGAGLPPAAAGEPQTVAPAAARAAEAVIASPRSARREARA